jgi:hypothetical protein
VPPPRSKQEQPSQRLSPPQADAAVAEAGGLIDEAIVSSINAAGVVGVTTSVADLTEGKILDAIRKAVDKVLQGFIKWSTTRKDNEYDWLSKLLRSKYPKRPIGEIERAAQDELKYEQEFQRRMQERLKRDLPVALSATDATKRAELVQKLLDREARYLQMREEAKLNRAVNAIERSILKESSPSGAYWWLSPDVKKHTPDCLAFGGKFWPWEVINKVHPPVHHGCACRLYGAEEALSAGWIEPGDLPEAGDAIIRANAIIKRYSLLKEAEVNTEEIATFLQEAVVGGRHQLRWGKGLQSGGQFRPLRGGVPGLRSAARRALNAFLADTSPLANKATSGRFVTVNNRSEWVPERGEKVLPSANGDLYSPAGSTNLYNKGKLVSSPGQSTVSVPEPEVPLNERINSVRERLQRAPRKTVTASITKLDVNSPPVASGDGPEVFFALEDAGFVPTMSTKNKYGGLTHQWKHIPTGSVLVFGSDDQMRVRDIRWQPGQKPANNPALSSYAPTTFDQFAEQAIAWAHWMGDTYDEGAEIASFNEDLNFGDTAGQRGWGGDISIGPDVRAAVETVAQLRADGTPLTNHQLEHLYRAYQCSAHELVHCVKMPDWKEWPGNVATDAQTAVLVLEESLTEEISHVIAADRLRAEGQLDVLAFIRDNPSVPTATGVYHDYRHRLGTLLDLAEIAPEDRQVFLMNLKFQHQTGEERFGLLGDALLRAGQVNTREQGMRLAINHLTSEEHSALLSKTPFTPILRPNYGETTTGRYLDPNGTPIRTGSTAVIDEPNLPTGQVIRVGRADYGNEPTVLIQLDDGSYRYPTISNIEIQTETPLATPDGARAGMTIEWENLNGTTGSGFVETIDQPIGHWQLSVRTATGRLAIITPNNVRSVSVREATDSERQVLSRAERSNVPAFTPSSAGIMVPSDINGLIDGLPAAEWSDRAVSDALLVAAQKEVLGLSTPGYSADEEELLSSANPSLLDSLKDGTGPVEGFLRSALNSLGVDPYDVDWNQLDFHADIHEAAPKSRVMVAGANVSPCAQARGVDFAVHVLLPELLREKFPVVAQKLRLTSPRWGWRSGNMPTGVSAPQTGGYPEPVRTVIPNYDGLDLTIGKPAGGSNGARWAFDDNGHRWLIKAYRGDRDRVATELLANRVYAALGVPVADAGTRRVTLPRKGGGSSTVVALAYPTLDGETRTINSPSTELGSAFMADALIGNWDVIGLTDDNVLWTADDSPVRIDQGGTFERRAMGGEKDFGPVPTEVWTMRSPQGQAFGKMNVSEQQMREQAAHISNTLSPAAIDSLVDAAPFADQDMRERIRENLNARVAWMRAFAAGEEGLPEPLSGPDAAEVLALNQDFEVFPQEDTSLRWFAAGGFQDVTEHLRSGAPKEAASPGVQENVSIIDDLLSAITPLDDDIVVYAGVAADIGPGQVGGSFTDSSFGLMSLDESTVPSGSTTLRVTVPHDSMPVMYLNGLQGLDDLASEPQIVLNRGIRYRVVAVETKNGRKVVDVVAYYGPRETLKVAPNSPGYRTSMRSKRTKTDGDGKTGTGLEIFGIGRSSYGASLLPQSKPAPRTPGVTAPATNKEAIDRHIAEHGPYAYHRTDATTVETIETDGLVPQDPEEMLGLGGGRPGSVYLFVPDRTTPMYGSEQFRVDLRKLDPENFRFDEDALSASPHFSNADAQKWGYEGAIYDVGDSELFGKGNPFDTPEGIATSLSVGTVAYNGTISPDLIERNPDFWADPERARKHEEVVNGQKEFEARQKRLVAEVEAAQKRVADSIVGQVTVEKPGYNSETYAWDADGEVHIVSQPIFAFQSVGYNKPSHRLPEEVYAAVLKETGREEKERRELRARLDLPTLPVPPQTPGMERQVPKANAPAPASEVSVVRQIDLDGSSKQVAYAEVGGLQTTTRVFAAFVEGRGPVALLTVDPKTDTLELAYTEAEYRRFGLASSLLDVARRETGAALTSDSGKRSPMGKEWANSLGVEAKGDIPFSQQDADNTGMRIKSTLDYWFERGWDGSDITIRDVSPENYPPAPQSPGTERPDNLLGSLLELADTWNQLRDKRDGWKYNSAEELIAAEGRSWTPQSLPDSAADWKGKMKECYANSSTAVLGLGKPKLEGTRYVEGFVRIEGTPLPIAHAWAVDENGLVLELTMDEPGVEYHGIEVPNEELLALIMRRDGYPGVIDNWQEGWPLLKYGGAAPPPPQTPGISSPAAALNNAGAKNVRTVQTPEGGSVTIGEAELSDTSLTEAKKLARGLTHGSYLALLDLFGDKKDREGFARSAQGGPHWPMVGDNPGVIQVTALDDGTVIPLALWVALTVDANKDKNYVKRNRFSQGFWTGVQDGDYLMHGTVRSVAEKVLKSKLKVNKGGRVQNDHLQGAFLTASANQASWYANRIASRIGVGVDDERVLLVVDVAQMKKDGVKPKLIREPSWESRVRERSLAKAVGIESWLPAIYDEGRESEGSTVIAQDSIPARYISIVSLPPEKEWEPKGQPVTASRNIAGEYALINDKVVQLQSDPDGKGVRYADWDLPTNESYEPTTFPVNGKVQLVEWTRELPDVNGQPATPPQSPGYEDGVLTETDLAYLADGILERSGQGGRSHSIPTGIEYGDNGSPEKQELQKWLNDIVEEEQLAGRRDPKATEGWAEARKDIPSLPEIRPVRLSVSTYEPDFTDAEDVGPKVVAAAEYMNQKITVRPNVTDLTLLHELAHLLAGEDYGADGTEDPHGEKWAEILLRLYEKYISPEAAQQWRELYYTTPN